MNDTSSEEANNNPLLERSHGHEHEYGGEAREVGWWKKVLDVEEAKNQVLFSLPMIVTNVSYYCIPLVSVMFAGHLGELQLAASNLANSWSTVTGLAFMTWKGLSVESFGYVVTSLKLALPSAAMVCLEYWAFELLVLLAGLMPNAVITTPLIAMWYGCCSLYSCGYILECQQWSQRISNHVNTEAIAYMITYGLSAAASQRVSNELGAGNPDRAKHAMGVTLKLSTLLALLVVSALGLGHNIWSGFFSSSSVIIEKFASMTPLLVVSILFDSVQGVLSGVARGCGWQHLAVYINLAMFYLIGMPIAAILGFKLKLYAMGLWMGLICGLSCQAGSLLLLTRLTKWTRLEVCENDPKENPVLA
ncbi:hypothetical protein RJ639_039620 [Escallonia herrerae]|uniref:Uncharacterized protein n=1 Tax=Escallonia herrerae TaxID=1293975 RepID=A0AA89B5D3_9ASTE|nr:hypothetical protein RJ639_039620 [Escallonia herrerae]